MRAFEVFDFEPAADEVVVQAAGSLAVETQLETLTAREVELLQACSLGQTNPQTGRNLYPRKQ